MRRRRFLQTSLLTATAALGTVWRAAPAVAEPGGDARVQRYRRLGRTGIEMSDISFGAAGLPASSLILRAIDRGMNYFDTAPDYGPSEAFLGKALKKFGERERIHLASKFCGLPDRGRVNHLRPGASKADYKAAVEQSLRRLRTDYLDVVMVHAIGEEKDYEQERRRLLDESMLAAFQDLRGEGKVRYLGVSSHGPHNMERLLGDAVVSGHFDVIMLAFNFLKFPHLPQLLTDARDRGIGVIAMKTLAGARDAGITSQVTTFEQAAFRWVLKHAEVAGLVITVKRVADFDRFLPASGQAFTAADQAALDEYAALNGADYCRTGCGDCESSCPAGVPVATILRQQMYFADYHEEKGAMGAYRALGRPAASCLGCAAQPCSSACPYGLRVATKLAAAHRDLGSWA